nr:transglycosylase domain-containing protein [Treponema denticola]
MFSRLYFGNGKYGLIDTAKCYYNKKYSELSEKEFISLCLLLTNPVIYDFTNEEIKQYSEEKVNQIYKKLKKNT